MTESTGLARKGTKSKFIESLGSYAQSHKARHWKGTFAEFLEQVLPQNPDGVCRNSHQYIWDMLQWKAGHSTNGQPDSAIGLFSSELYGVDDALERVADYFKAASAGSEVGRRLLLLLGPPSGGKSTVVILLKRGLEEYSHTDEGYGVDIAGELCPHNRARLDSEFEGDFMKMPVERIFLSEAARVGVGTYAPHDPTTADIADLVGSVDLSKVAEIGDEGDPRAWSWSGAVYAASRGVLEMIEILKVKREFLYLLLTLTQEKNVKVSRFPLIYLDETILAHTNMAEFRKFLQEKENEALLDRMVIVQVPYTLSYQEEARIYKKLISSARAFQNVHLDPHALKTSAVFSVLTRFAESEREDLDVSKKARLFAGEDAEGFSESEIDRIRAEAPEEGLGGISPRFIVNALSNAIIKSEAQSLTTMEVLLTLKDAIESDARIDIKQKRTWIDLLVTARKDFYNRWVKEDIHRALFASFEEEAEGLLEKYLDEVEAMLDNREVTDSMTSDTRPPDERFLRSVEEKINISDAGKESFRQEVVRKAMVAYKQGEKFSLGSHSKLKDAVEQYLFEERRDVLRLVTSVTRPDDEVAAKISAVEERLVSEYGYDTHSAKEALSYVTTLLSQE
jgi:serine protein kinase